MKEWYQQSIKEIEKNLETNSQGLTSKEALKRIEKYGKNELPKQNNASIMKIILEELKDPIVIILLITVIFCFAIHEVVDAIAILFIILVDLIMGTYQEWKAIKNALALSNMISVTVKVLRDKKEVFIDSSELVLGDVVFLESGDKISADLRLMNTLNLQINESILTGESVSVVKNNVVLEQKVPLAETKNMAFAGTSVVTGRAMAIVVATGTNTEIGKIANKVIETKEEKSPLTIRMDRFSKQISIAILIVAVLLSFILYFKNYTLENIFLLVISLSVSAMPEGLPLALTMALTIASNRMAKKNVIVKKLNAVESLGSCTIIASDKTGTLTVNEQTAKKIVLPNGDTFEIEGTGYNNHGKVKAISNSNIKDAEKIGLYGVLNNEASLEKIDGKWKSFGDSIDIAFLALGEKLKISKENIKIISSIPYESENQYSAVFYKEKEKVFCTVKGSLEVVSHFCATQGKDKQELNLDLLQKQNEELAKEGYRVIALAAGEIEECDEYKEDSIWNLNFVGMVAFIDPIRVEVRGSLQEAREAGIKVVMITGDHPFTAYSIAKELKLAISPSEVATGEEIEKYLKKGTEIFDEFIKNKTVFSRVTPLDKLEIVESYKRNHEFVAVTGDGVNDAPALKSANIGIAMGSGTDVAKETASMIIIDDNFKSIVEGIKEGRNAYSNIRKVSYMLLSCGIAELLFFILSIVFSLPTPLVAIQLLWLNVVTDGLQDFALSFEKAEKGIMKEKPRSTKESLFNKELIEEVLLSGFTIGILVFVVWYYLIEKVGMEDIVARGYVMALMVFIQNIHVLNCRSEKESTFKVPFKNPLIIVAIVSSILLQVLVMEVPFFSTFLKTQSIPFLHLFYLFMISFVVLLVMEIYKSLKRKKC